MTWRPWILAALALAVSIVNGALLYHEEVHTPESAAEVVDEVKDELLGLAFSPSQRQANFKAFGLSDDLAAKAYDQTRRIDARSERLEEVLKEDADVVGLALCPGSGLPQRYAALAFLVKEAENERSVLTWERITGFEIEDWYAKSPVDAVYAEVELTSERHEDATAMAIASILLKRETDLLDGTTPWGRGLGKRWSQGAVHKRYPQVTRRLVEYFALMHVLVEIANHPSRGICS